MQSKQWYRILALVFVPLDQSNNKSGGSRQTIAISPEINLNDWKKV